MHASQLLLATFLTVAAAAPGAVEATVEHGCDRPGWYVCGTNGQGGGAIFVCSGDKKWRAAAMCTGTCPCSISKQNNVPYCAC